MKKSIKKILTLVLATSLFATCLSACDKNEPASSTSTSTSAKTDTSTATSTDTSASQTTDTDNKGEMKVIRYGTHWKDGIDPYAVDDVTGEYKLNEAERDAILAGLNAIEVNYNVTFEFVQYADDTRNELMTSVLAGDPVCDLAILWGGSEGTVLGQNVLKPLDDYAYIFDDPDYSWMLYDKLYGHNYLLSSVKRYYQRWPLLFNATMIEKVDTLKDANGKTIYPTDLFLEGNWTWSTFEDYLAKIDAFYSSTPVADCIYPTVTAYETDHRMAGLSAMYSAGAAIYGPDGLTPDSDEAIKALKWFKGLMDQGLMKDCGLYDDDYTPVWCQSAYDFGRGGSVFADVPDWLINGEASNCSDRGESVGIVPWPRPDDMAFDDPAYGQCITLGDSVGVLKGVDDETTELALKAFALFWKTYYEVKGATNASLAADLGLDIYNETYGADILSCFDYITQHLVNDYADLLSVRVPWDDIWGKGIYGIDGMASYEVGVKANMANFTNVSDVIAAALSSDNVKDNMAPEISNQRAYIAKGTDVATIDWSQYYTVTDKVDGEIPASKGTFEIINDSFSTDVIGKHSNSVELTIKDAAGNEAKSKISVVVYDGESKTPPTVTVADPVPTVLFDTPVANINVNDFITKAVDKDDIDVSALITADWSTIDTTTPGKYDVKFTIADYAGNVTEVTVNIEVVAE